MAPSGLANDSLLPGFGKPGTRLGRGPFSGGVAYPGLGQVLLIRSFAQLASAAKVLRVRPMLARYRVAESRTDAQPSQALRFPGKVRDPSGPRSLHTGGRGRSEGAQHGRSLRERRSRSCSGRGVKPDRSKQAPPCGAPSACPGLALRPPRTGGNPSDTYLRYNPAPDFKPGLHTKQIPAPSGF